MPRAVPTAFRGTLRGTSRGPARPSEGFAVLRLAAVLLVVLDHCAPLTGHGPTVLPRALGGGVGLDLGALAVRALFAMSGFQVARSWAADPHVGRFLAKRVLRLAPPLVVVLLLSALVLGPVATALPVRDYLADERTWRYVLDNAVLHTTYRLPGVFEANPYPGAPVNGSLWTLPMEAAGYLLVVALGLTGAALGGRWAGRAAGAALVALLAGRLLVPGTAGDAPTLLHVPLDALVSMLAAFALGVVLAGRGPRPVAAPAAGGVPAGGVPAGGVPVGGRVVALLVGVAVVAAVARPLPGAAAAQAVCQELAAGCAAVVAAHRWPARLVPPRALRSGSYGTYLCAFPVQQSLIALGVASAAGLAAAALPVAWALGVASWHLVEAPTQALRADLDPPGRRNLEPWRSSDVTGPAP